MTMLAAPATVDPIPVGWHEVDRPLTDVTYPVQIYAAATYPIVLRHPPGRCGPPLRVLREIPPGGVLQAQVWTRRATVDPRLRAGALRILDHLS